MFHHEASGVLRGVFRHDPVECDGWEVLNGVARVGSEVSYAVRDGNIAAMRLGIVRDYTIGKRYSRMFARLKVEVTGSSEFGVVYGKIVPLEHLARISLIVPTTARYSPFEAGSTIC